MFDAERTFDEVDFEAKTVSHQMEVARLLIDMSTELLRRAKEHDKSKLEQPERERFIEATKGLAGLTYGSPEYSESLKKLGPAREHHYSMNRHHPQHHENVEGAVNVKVKYGDPVGRMSLVDVVEMLCDWVAASKRHDDGDVGRSLEINKDRFQISDQVNGILKRTIEDMGW